MEKVRFLNKLLKKSDDTADPEKKHFIYIQSKWADNGLEIHVHNSDTNNSFKGELRAEDLNLFAGELDVPFDEFYQECKEALTANVTLPPFEYEIREEELKFLLIKKQNFAIEYLEVPLKSLSNNDAMLDVAIDIIDNLRESKEDQMKMVKNDDNASKEMMQVLKDCVKEKEEIEKKLMRKFLMLLNSKKEKIRQLKQLLEDKNHNESSADDHNESTIIMSKNMKRARMEKTNSQNDEIEDDFDEDYDALTQVS